MTPHPPSLSDEDIARLPAAEGNYLNEIRQAFATGRRKVVVVDDDPTGTQTTSAASLVASWEEEDIDWLLRRPEDIGFVLTNSRAADEDRAVEIANTVGARIRQCADRLGITPLVISRSDSTLRGHFPAENQALAEGGDFGERGTVLVPFFAEGGRITVDGVHYVRSDDGYVPAASTPFADDASFGYQESDLRAWVEEKSGGAIGRDQVVSIPLRELRQQGPDMVADRLAEVPFGGVCVVDAVTYQDLELFVAGMYRSVTVNSWLFRSAASLVPVLAGRSAAAPVPAPPGTGGGGLVVVGSHVPLSSRQLEHLTSRPNLDSITIHAGMLNDPRTAEAEIQRVRSLAELAMNENRTAVVATSRQLVSNGDPLAISRRVADGLCRLVSQLTVTPSFVVAKGGITSHTLAVDALGARRARVLGPIIPGVPMWEMDENTRYPGLPYVVFPGNVGDDRALGDVVGRLDDRRP